MSPSELYHRAKQAWEALIWDLGPELLITYFSFFSPRLFFLTCLILFPSPLASSSLFLFHSSQVVCRRSMGSCVQSSVRRTLSSGWPVRTTGFLLQTCRRPRPAASTASLSTRTPRRRLVERRVWYQRNTEHWHWRKSVNSSNLIPTNEEWDLVMCAVRTKSRL